MPDNVPGDASTTIVIPFGIPISSTVDYYGDSDWFAIELTAGVGYYFTVYGSGDTPALDVVFEVYGPNGYPGLQTTMGTSDSDGSPWIDGFLAYSSGTYYVNVTGIAPFLGTQGGYTIVATPMVDTIGAGIGTNGVVEVGQTIFSSIDTLNDHDWFRIDLVGGQIYEFLVEEGRSYSAQLWDPNLVIYDANGNFYATLDDGPGRSTHFFAEIAESGTYYIATSLFSGFQAHTGTYQLSVDVEAAANTTTQISLTAGETQNGSLLWEGDVDWYAIELEAGVTYEFYFDGQLAGADLSSAHINFDVHLDLYNGAGSHVADEGPRIFVGPYGYSTYAPILQFTAATAGTYYIAVSGVDAQDLGYYGIAYGVVDTSTDVIAGDVSTAATLAVGATLNGVLESRGDHDWIAVQLVAGQSYTMSALGNDPGKDVAPSTVIWRADGTLLSLNNTFVADATGTYYIDVWARPTGSNAVATLAPPGEGGAYTLTLTADAVGSVNTSVELQVGETITASTPPSDLDWIRINLVAGETYLITLDQLGTFTSLSADLSLFNAAGTEILNLMASNDYLVYTPTTSGTYYIQTWGHPNGYTVGLQQLNTSGDAYTGNQSTTGVITTASPVTSAIEYASDTDWFAFSVQQGQYYTLTLTGIGVDALEAAGLSVGYDTSYVAYGETTSGTLTVSFFAESTRTLWAGVSANSSFGILGEPARVLSEETGGYTLTLEVSAPTVDTLANNNTTTGVATVGNPFQSTIDFLGDQDWVRVTLEAGEYYSFEISGARFDIPGYFGSTSSYYAAVSGDVFVRVQPTSYYNGGQYTLTVNEASPVDALSGAPVTPKADGVFRICFSTEFVGWSEERIATVLSAWSAIAEYADIQFEVTTDAAIADFTYIMYPGTGNDGGRSDMIDGTYLFYTGGEAFGEEDFAGYGGAVPGGMGWANLLQQIGMQLGLGGTSGSGGLAGVTEVYHWGTFWLNQGVYTMMGYYDGWRSGRLLQDDVPDSYKAAFGLDISLVREGIQATPMALDIAALQAIYGANTTANAGDTTFNISAITNGQFRAIWDTGGTDTLMVAAGDTHGAVLDLRAATLDYEWGGGGFISYVRNVPGGYTIAGGVVIENASGGAGNDRLIGNQVANVLSGGGGDDVLVGGDGADTLSGGLGSDTASYELSNSGVTLDLQDAGQNTGDAADDTWSSIENLTGSAHADTLRGDAGANVLDGGEGADTLVGRGGNDTYVVDDANDAVIEAADGGIDTVLGLGNAHTLSDHVENLTLAGVTSAGITRYATGNALANTLIGSNGNDVLDGAVGADTMIGGVGDDTYHVDEAGDVVTEVAGSGQGFADTVLSAISAYTLTANVENGSIVGAGGAALTGNDLNNRIIGDAGNDTLSGLAGNDRLEGAAGIDTLDGGLGDDILEGGAGGDVIIGGSGSDTASFSTSASAVTVSLLASSASGGDATGDTLSQIENLTGSAFNDVLTGDGTVNILTGADGADTLNGEDGNDVLRGGAGIDTLNGGVGNDDLDGGAGADVMAGQIGDDTYRIDDVGDTVVEVGGQGTDIALVSVSGYALAAEVENGTIVITGDITLTGNGLANTLTGGGGYDILYGGGGDDILNGGLGVDTMYGGAGNDTYYVAQQVDPNSVLRDKPIEEVGGGTDTVIVTTYIEYFLDANIENAVSIEAQGIFGNELNNQITGGVYQDTLFGRDGNDTLIGNQGDDLLFGGNGSDSLTGGLGDDVLEGQAGDDVMAGGTGDDEYYVNSLGDSVNENASAGYDTVYVTVTGYTLSNNVEAGIVYTPDNESLTGNALDNALTGGTGDNVLSGGDGNDVLKGGWGNDTLNGGAGFDLALYDDAVTGITVSLLLQGTTQFISGLGNETLISIEDLAGGDYNDTLIGDAIGNFLYGLDGNDTLTGNDGDDGLAGGAGDDRLEGGAGNDMANYEDAEAGVTATLAIQGVSQNTIGAGNDTLFSIENLGGSIFNDTLYGDGAANVVLGYFGNDTLFGNDGDDTLFGEAGDDTLDGGAGADTMAGGTGNDVYILGAGDTITELSGEGLDTVRSSFTYTLGANLEYLVLTGAAAIDGIGNAIGNIITGNAASNTLSGGGGSDTLVGGLGNDILNGDDGNDTIVYAFGDGVDTIDGGNGTDTLTVTAASGAQTLTVQWGGTSLSAFNGGSLTSIEQLRADLGAGVDVLSYAGSTAGATINIATSSASGFTQIIGVDNVVGSSFADMLAGASSNNNLSGGDGDDQIYGFGGNDVLLGGNGVDLLVGEGGDDAINGGAGNDTIRYTVGHGLDTIDGGDGTDTLAIFGRPTDDILGVVWNGSVFTSFKGGALTSIERATADLSNGVDILRYTGSTAAVSVDIAAGTATGFLSIIGVESVDGTNFNDNLSGNSNSNTLNGSDGNDTLSGLGGNDTLLGGGGVDSIRGGGGDDIIDAGIGADTVHYTLGDGLDTINGGGGVDTLAITGTSAGEVLGMIWNGSFFTSFKGGTLTSIETATLDLGGGVDTLRYAGSNGNINVNLANGTATGFTSIAGVENVVGATVVDNLTGDGNANNLDGQGGNDVLTGGGGDDTLTGSSGNDRFVFATGSGADTVTDFDANAAGGQDLMDLTGYGITSLDFNARVVITDQGSDTLVTIDGGASILLTGVTGDGANVVTLSDFLLS